MWSKYKHPIQKKISFHFVDLEKKITETFCLQRRQLYEEMICSEDIKPSIFWVALGTQMFSYKLPPTQVIFLWYSGSKSETQSHLREISGYEGPDLTMTSTCPQQHWNPTGTPVPVGTKAAPLLLNTDSSQLSATPKNPSHVSPA